MNGIIDRIHEFNRFGSVLGLERMGTLMKKLGDPHRELNVIHVAGTNGKGSVCKFIQEGLSSCGYSVGLFSSPYVECFNERIQLGGSNISDEDLENFGSRVLEAAAEMVGEGLESPTEFEVVTAIALLYFAERKADIAVLEVGLGGRGDSTNIVEKPLICAITSISYDHMNVLGDTLAQIAWEKAGIIKPGVPVVSNVDDREAAAVIAKTAYERGCRLYDVSRIKTEATDEGPASQTVTMELYGTDYSDVEISMAGRHQRENLKTALAVIEVLRKERKIKVERGALYEGLKRAVQPGRFEILSAEPTIVIDGAHNEAGAKALMETVRRNFAGRRILLVTGMLADKAVDDILASLVEITKDIVVTEPDNPRRLPAVELAERLRRMGSDPAVASDPSDSLRMALERSSDYDVILFAGSLYLIGDIRRMIVNGEEE